MSYSLGALQQRLPKHERQMPIDCLYKTTGTHGRALYTQPSRLRHSQGTMLNWSLVSLFRTLGVIDSAAQFSLLNHRIRLNFTRYNHEFVVQVRLSILVTLLT